MLLPVFHTFKKNPINYTCTDLCKFMLHASWVPVQKLHVLLMKRKQQGHPYKNTRFTFTYLPIRKRVKLNIAHCDNFKHQSMHYRDGSVDNFIEWKIHWPVNDSRLLEFTFSEYSHQRMTKLPVVSTQTKLTTTFIHN